MTCGWLLCKEGDGTLEKTFTNYTQAVKFVTGKKKTLKKLYQLNKMVKLKKYHQVTQINQL